MGYYMRGDYYRGDYYRGDPFLGALIGSVARSVGLGSVASKAAKWVGGKLLGTTAKQAATGALTAAGAVATGVTLAGAIPKINVGTVSVDPGSLLPGGKPFVTWGRKKYRRLNPLNPKALKRALRRAEGFEKFAKRTVNALYKNVDGRRTRTFKKCTPTRS